MKFGWKGKFMFLLSYGIKGTKAEGDCFAISYYLLVF